MYGLLKWLQNQSVALHIEDDIDVSTVIDNSRTQYEQTWYQVSLSSVVRCKQLHQDYVLAPYLSTAKHLGNHRLISRFRCGCHGLHVDTGRFLRVGQRVPREQRFCLVCGSHTAEDEHHFLFDCPAYCHIRNNFDAIFWGPVPTLSSFFALHDPKVIGRFLKECFAYRNTLLTN